MQQVMEDPAPQALRHAGSKQVEPSKSTGSPAEVAIKLPAILFQGDDLSAGTPSGPGERYALGSTPSGSHPAGGTPSELPEAYGTRRLMLAARDPHWLCAWWDLTTEQQQSFNQQSATGHLALRLFLNEAVDQPVSEVELYPESKNWFIQVEQSGARYVAELGYPSKHGAWVQLALSPPAVTPTGKPDEESAEPQQFLTLPADLPNSQLVELVKGALQEQAPLVEAIEQIRAQEQIGSLAESTARQEEQPVPIQHSDPAFVTDEAMRHEESEPGAPKVRMQFSPPAFPWTREQEYALTKVLHQDAERRVWLGSLEITELVRRQWEHQLWSGAFGEFPGWPGGFPELAEQAKQGGVSSPIGGAKPTARGFWFNVNAELVIYGATAPDAKVTIGGRLIKLREDGSFSYRFALPDGKYELPVVAHAADGQEARQARLRFSRRTHCVGDVEPHPQDPALQAPRPERAS